MAYLSKEAYERKAAWAERRARINKENESLTEEQHDTLAWLCEIRHEMHCNQDSFYYSEYPKHNQFWNYINDEASEEGEIQHALSEVSLPELNWSFDPDDCDTDSICCELDFTDEEKEEARKHCLEVASQVNDDIERYLRQIDKQYGTDYAPSGATRFY